MVKLSLLQPYRFMGYLFTANAVLASFAACFCFCIWQFPPVDRVGRSEILESSIRLAIVAGTMAILAVYTRKSGMNVKIGDPGLE